MSKPRDPNRDKAFKLWVKSGKLMKPAEIAMKLGIDAARVRKWKSEEEWEAKPDPKRGAPRGNKNAKDNKGGGAPLGNVNAFVNGLRSKRLLPNNPALLALLEESGKCSPLDLLGLQIRTLSAQILNSIGIMNVSGPDDETKVLKKLKPGMFGEEQEWEYQHAWDKQGRALAAQSTAMSRLTTMIKQYEAMLRTLPACEVNEKQRLEIEKLKIEVKKLDPPSKQDNELTIIIDYGDGADGDSQGAI